MRKRKKQRIANIATALLVVCLVIATARFFNWGDKISGLFHNNSSPKPKTVKEIPVLDETITKDGLTLKATQAYGDKGNLYILCEVTTLDGTIFNEDSLFEKIDVSFNKSKGLGWGYSIISESKNTRTYLLDVITPKSLNKQTVTISFENLGAYGLNATDFNTSLKGQWKLSWKLDYPDTSIDYKFDLPVTIFNGESKLKNISISDRSAVITMAGSSISKYKNNTDELAENPYSPEHISFEFKNKSVLKTGQFSNCQETINKDTMTIVIKFNDPIDPSTITSISLDNTVATLGEEK